MALEFSLKPDFDIFASQKDNCPNWISVIAYLWLLAGDLTKVFGRWRLGKEVYFLARYDKGRRDLRRGTEVLRVDGQMLSVLSAFMSFLTIYLLIEFLQYGVLEWLR
jgi:hypothetical protein